MATVKDAMDTFALQCAIPLPNSWIAASTRRTYQEAHSILAIVVEELLDRVDWPDPITKDTTITGTGVEEYSLPSDFKRLTKETDNAGPVYETTTTRRFAIPVTSNSKWTNLEQFGSAGGNRYYRTAGTEEDGFTMSFFQPLETDAEVIVSYVSVNWLTLEGTEGSAWESDDATLLLPRRLVELGCVWRWKQRKGLPYQDVLNEYEAKLARLANEMRGKRVICFGEADGDQHPMRVPVPDFIPAS